ncbi:MAG: diguanylate cyclase [Anaerolineales bacterium]|jgi:hypothetical protein|nr:diguanylate cyclase [Anaerolineales bacterium]
MFESADEEYLNTLFDYAPISLWEQDFSPIKRLFDGLRQSGVTSLETYLDERPDFVEKCMLFNNLHKILRDEMGSHFANELLDLWNGKLAYEREGINYALSGEPVNIQLDFRVMPGHEYDFSWALVAIQDVTARKKAEDYLRVAEALNAAFDANHVCARMGGDEFAVIIENENESDAMDYIKQLEVLIELNNKYYREPELSLSLGFAVSAPGVSLEKVVGLADDAMYRDKNEHHRRRKDDPQA